jgi:hypothetical protein
MATVIEEPKVEAKSGATPHSDEPRTEAEKKAVKCFEDFQQAEDRRGELGNKFGQAMVKLRDEIKANGSRDFRKRLEELDITYDTARYWMDKAGGKPTDRHKTDSPKPQQRSDFNWDAAVARLEDLKDDIYMLKQVEPQGIDILFEPLAGLAELLGYQVVTR